MGSLYRKHISSSPRSTHHVCFITFAFPLRINPYTERKTIYRIEWKRAWKKTERDGEMRGKRKRDLHNSRLCSATLIPFLHVTGGFKSAYYHSHDILMRVYPPINPQAQTLPCVQTKCSLPKTFKRSSVLVFKHQTFLWWQISIIQHRYMISI